MVFIVEECKEIVDFRIVKESYQELIVGCEERSKSEREIFYRFGQFERFQNCFGMEKFEERNEVVRDCGELSVRFIDFEVIWSY